MLTSRDFVLRRYVMKKLGVDRLDADALLDEADKNRDGVIQYDGASASLSFS